MRFSSTSYLIVRVVPASRIQISDTLVSNIHFGTDSPRLFTHDITFFDLRDYLKYEMT